MHKRSSPSGMAARPPGGKQKAAKGIRKESQ
jgi:hypothetical protein